MSILPKSIMGNLITCFKKGTFRHFARDDITIKKALNSETGILEYFDKKEMEREWGQEE